jgi:hypothetical protein
MQGAQYLKTNMAKTVHSPNSECSEDPMGVSTPLTYNGSHMPRTSIHSNTTKENSQQYSERQHTQPMSRQHTQPTSKEPATVATPQTDEK